MAPRKRGALSQQQFNQLTSKSFGFEYGSVGLPFTDTKINIPSAAPLGMLHGVGDLLFGTMVGRTQAENIANRLAGNEPLGLMESMKEQAQEQVLLAICVKKVVDYQKKQGVKDRRFISKTGLTDFFANNPKYSSLDVAPSSIGGKTQPFSTRSGLERSWFCRRLFSTKSDIQSWREHCLFEDAILGGQFDDDIKTTGEFCLR